MAARVVPIGAKALLSVGSLRRYYIAFQAARE